MNNGHVVEASLGYFINPLVSVAAGGGVPARTAAPGAVGGGRPGGGGSGLSVADVWRAALDRAGAGVFVCSVRGCLRNLLRLRSLHSFTIELAVMLLPALGYVVFCGEAGNGGFRAGRLGTPAAADGGPA